MLILNTGKRKKKWLINDKICYQPIIIKSHILQSLNNSILIIFLQLYSYLGQKKY